jgi:glycosyltransferase involved in cell wall biosynthesis
MEPVTYHARRHLRTETFLTGDLSGCILPSIPVRILFANDFGYLFGGAEVYAHGMAEALRRRGHEVRWLTTSVRRGQSLFRLSGETTPFHDDWFCRGSDSDYRLRRGWQQFRNRSAAEEMESLTRSWKPDVVHLHGFLSQLSPLVLEPLSGVATVASAHTYKAVCPKATKLRPDGTVCSSTFGLGCVASQCLPVADYAHERIKRARFGALFGRIRLWIAPSHYVQSVFEPEVEAPVRVLHHGTDLHELRRPKKNGNGVVLYAGRLVDTKGVDVLLRSMKEVRRLLPKATLWIAGNGPWEGKLRALSEELGLAGAVEFLGHQDRASLVELHRKVDVLAAPALWPEPLPITVLEAMALGTPIVATAVGGHGDAVTDGENGRLVAPGDSRALAEALASVLADEDRRRALERASLAASEKFRLSSLASSLESLYAEARQSLPPVRLWPHVDSGARAFPSPSNAFWRRPKLRGPRPGTWERRPPGAPHLS